ncbi:MAG: hypothetical protein KBS55_06290 [Bacteroidales bacterium]|nr:hypothetical protein [Candidatus Cryptobacteroides aphodequi]
MKKMLRMAVIAAAALCALCSCHWDDNYTKVKAFADDAIMYCGETVNPEGLCKYTLELSGSFTDTAEQFVLSIVFYDFYAEAAGYPLVPSGYYYGSNSFGEGKMLYGSKADNMGTFIGIRARDAKDFEWYPVNSGSFEIECEVGRDGTPAYEIEANVYVADYKYHIDYIGPLRLDLLY